MSSTNYDDEPFYTERNNLFTSADDVENEQLKTKKHGTTRGQWFELKFLKYLKTYHIERVKPHSSFGM